jgi:glycerol-3-phosphate dehydrogenase (NAD(P)+)
MSNFNIAVLGAGSWGTALSMVLCSKGHKVNLWMRSKKQYTDMMRTYKNDKYLPDIKLPANLNLHVDLQKTVSGAGAILISVSSQSVREVLQKIGPYLTGNGIII